MSRKTDQIDEIVRDHHDAFLIEVLGPLGCGLPPERVQALRERGLVSTQGIATHAGAVPPGTPYDPIQYLRGVGKYLADHPTEYADLKDMSDVEWWPKVQRVLRRLDEDKLRVPGMHHVTGVVHLDDEGHPEVSPGIPIPRDKPEPRTKDGRAVAGEDGLVPVSTEFKGASPMDRAAYHQALTRAGEFCRGLGNIWSESLKQVVAEKWNGEEIEASPRADLRDETLQKIRTVVAAAWKSGKSAGSLAAELARTTGDYTRDWGRIARTELQAAYNDGVAIDAVQKFGAEARIVRVPERSACKDCLRLLLENGVPIIWDVRELVRNGTNAGRGRAAWKATVFPIHPKCSCGTLIAPTGYKADRFGRLSKA